MSFTPYAQDGTNRGYGFVNGLYVPQLNNAPTIGFANTPFGAKQTMPQDETQALFGKRRTPKYFFPQESDAIAESVQIIFIVDTSGSMGWASALLPELINRLTSELRTKTQKPTNYALLEYTVKGGTSVRVLNTKTKGFTPLINTSDIPESSAFFTTVPSDIVNATSFSYSGGVEPVGPAAVTAANLSLHHFTVNENNITSFNPNTPFLFFIFADEQGETFVDLISSGTLAALPLPFEAQEYLNTQNGEAMSRIAVRGLMKTLVFNRENKTNYRAFLIYGAADSTGYGGFVLDNFPVPKDGVVIDTSAPLTDSFFNGVIDKVVNLISLQENGSPFMPEFVTLS